MGVGELYSLLCALIWAIAVILFRKSGETVPPVALNLFKNVLGLVLLVLSLAALQIGWFPPQATSRDWLMLTVSGILGIGIADSLFLASLNRLGAGNSALVDCLYSPLVIVCAFFFLHEHIGVSVLIGMGLTTAAILLSTWEPSHSQSKANRRQTLVGVLLGILAMWLMAVGIVLAKPVLAQHNPWWVSTVRLLAGSAFLLVQGTLSGQGKAMRDCFRPHRAWKVMIPSGLLGGYVAMVLWLAGMKYTLASKASVLNQTSTIFVVLLAALFLKERLTRRKALAVGMALVGTVLASK